MSRETRPPRTSVDSDGVRTVRTRAWWPVVVGGAALVVLIIMIRLAVRSDEPDSRATSAGARPQRKQLAVNPPAVKEGGRVRLIPVQRGAPTPPDDSRSETPPASTSAATEPARGIEDPNMPPTPPPSDYGWKGPAGIALFPPPGTNPPKPGIVVPDNFELPRGYMRHHQTTDDGRSLPPILAFHPDYEFVDEQGHPVQIPEDLVVPPELAPPGIPLDILEVPETVYPAGPSEGELQQILREHPELEKASPEEIERIMNEDAK